MFLQDVGCGYFVDLGKIKGQMSPTTGIEQVVKKGFVKYLDGAAFINGDERKNGVDEQKKVASSQLKKLFHFALVRIRCCAKKTDFTTPEVENAENKTDLLKLAKALNTLKDK